MTLLADPKKLGSVATNRDPVATDDIAKLITVGCRWENTSSGAVFVCKSNAPGAAVWGALAPLVSGTVPLTNLPATTGAKLATTAVAGAASFAGVAAPGPCTLTGATVGQRVLAVFQLDAASGNLATVPALFEATISIADQIQQLSASNLSTHKYAVILLPIAA